MARCSRPGSTNDEDALTASFNADLYDPVANTFSSAGANVFPRLYHSNALLLPDATVLLMGGNRSAATMNRDSRSIHRRTCSTETVRLRCVRRSQGCLRKP